MQPQLTVAGLLQGRSGTISLPLELLGGPEGTERPITSPHVQKTELALAGFHEYLQPGRVLVFGESEVRYLDALDSDTLLIPLLHMPVAPGRNLAILVEVAARNQLLRARGLNAARELASRLDQQLRDADGDAVSEEDLEQGGPV